MWDNLNLDIYTEIDKYSNLDVEWFPNKDISMLHIYSLYEKGRPANYDPKAWTANSLFGDWQDLNANRLKAQVCYSMFGYNGAVGYQIVMGTSSCSSAERWQDPANLLGDTIVAGDVLNVTFTHLNYLYNYAFSIRALDPRGASYDSATKTWTVDDSCPYHTKWYGRVDERHNTDYFRLTTLERYDVPDVVTISDRTETSFRVNFDLGVAAGQADEFPEFERDEDGNFVAQILSVTASTTNPDARIDSKWAAYPLSPDDLKNGYVDITDLEPNSAYVVDLLNTNVPYRVDQGYNMLAPRTTGEVGQPVFLGCPRLKMEYFLTACWI